MKEIILKTIEQVGLELDELSRKIYEKPETAYEEVIACKLHAEFLEKYGFLVERNFCGIETGFKAEYDSGKTRPYGGHHGRIRRTARNRSRLRP